MQSAGMGLLGGLIIGWVALILSAIVGASLIWFGFLDPRSPLSLGIDLGSGAAHGWSLLAKQALVVISDFFPADQMGLGMAASGLVALGVWVFLASVFLKIYANRLTTTTMLGYLGLAAILPLAALMMPSLQGSVLVSAAGNPGSWLGHAAVDFALMVAFVFLAGVMLLPHRTALAEIFLQSVIVAAVYAIVMLLLKGLGAASAAPVLTTALTVIFAWMAITTALRASAQTMSDHESELDAKTLEYGVRTLVTMSDQALQAPAATVAHAADVPISVLPSMLRLMQRATLVRNNRGSWINVWAPERVTVGNVRTGLGLGTSASQVLADTPMLARAAELAGENGSIDEIMLSQLLAEPAALAPTASKTKPVEAIVEDAKPEPVVATPAEPVAPVPVIKTEPAPQPAPAPKAAPSPKPVAQPVTVASAGRMVKTAPAAISFGLSKALGLSSKPATLEQSKSEPSKAATGEILGANDFQTLQAAAGSTRQPANDEIVAQAPSQDQISVDTQAAQSDGDQAAILADIRKEIASLMKREK